MNVCRQSEQTEILAGGMIPAVDIEGSIYMMYPIGV